MEQKFWLSGGTENTDILWKLETNTHIFVYNTLFFYYLKFNLLFLHNYFW